MDLCEDGGTRKENENNEDIFCNNEVFKIMLLNYSMVYPCISLYEIFID